MTKNQKYQPEYPILDRGDLVPREQIRIVPEENLNPLDRAELSNLRQGGVEYKLAIADTPENRRNIGIKTAYFQMVAYKEGWDFDPQKYQVRFVNPHVLILSEPGKQRRIYEYKEDTDHTGLSPERKIGYVISGDKAVRMKDNESDILAKLFKDIVFGKNQ